MKKRNNKNEIFLDNETKSCKKQKNENIELTLQSHHSKLREMRNNYDVKTNEFKL